MSLPPLHTVRVFDAVARHLSFTKAATELVMTQSAVSYQIKSLEAYVGAPLFVRKGRGVELSERGQLLAPAVRQALSELTRALNLAQEQNERILVVTTVATFASNWLAPRIGAFQTAHSDLAVRLDSSSRIVDLTTEDFDIAIRSGRGTWPGTISHRLFDISFTPMCSPAYLEREGPIETPKALMQRTLIDPDDPWWLVWFDKAGVTPGEYVERQGIDVELQQLAARIAINGHGVAILTPELVAEELTAGHLVRLFDIIASEDAGYYLVYAAHRRGNRKIILFRDWLSAELEKSGITHRLKGK